MNSFCKTLVVVATLLIGPVAAFGQVCSDCGWEADVCAFAAGNNYTACNNAASVSTDQCLDIVESSYDACVPSFGETLCAALGESQTANCVSTGLAMSIACGDQS
jgi:hypothetical protein